MPHWNAKGEEEWVCQKGAHICTGPSTWIEGLGNICEACSIIPTVVPCRVCHTEHTISAPIADIKRWRQGELIQNAMPYLSAHTRELLISGICGDCFNKLFKEYL